MVTVTPVDGADAPRALKPTVLEGEADFYKPQWRAVVTRSEFIFVACTSVLFTWLGVEADFNGGDIVFRIVRAAFGILFLLDVGLRMGAVERKGQLFRTFHGFPLLLDTVLTLLLLLGAALPADGRAMSLAQVLRVYRTVSVCPELRVLCLALLAPLRSIVWCVLAMMMHFYFFGLAFRTMAAGTVAGERFFQTLPDAMFTLLTHGLFMDGVAELLHSLRAEAAALVIVWLVFWVTCALLLVATAGIFCEVASTVAQFEAKKLMARYLAYALKQALGSDQAVEECLTSKEALVRILSDEDFARQLQRFKVNVDEAMASVDLIFAAGALPSLEALMLDLLQCQDCPARQLSLIRMERRLNASMARREESS